MGWNNAVFPLLIVTPSGGFTGLFLYSPGPGTGNLIGSWTAQAGVDPFGNSYPAGINVTSGVLSGVTIQSLSEVSNPGPVIVDGPAGLTFATFTTAGVNNWVAPVGVTSVQAFCWGPGHRGGNRAGDASGGGGGGEFASEPAVAVTPGNTYHPTVGTPGNVTTFAGDAVTVTAHSGQHGSDNPASGGGTGGAGGTGSTNTTHFDGGRGGNSLEGQTGGGGGGSAASNSQAGNAGHQNSGSTGGAGGGATPGGFLFSGGAGGRGGNNGGGGVAGVAPGGGGGGAGFGGASAAGANGQVILLYSTGTLKTNVVLASAAGADPLTGTSYGVGITSFDNTFGTVLEIVGASLTASGSAANITVNSAGVDVQTAGKGLLVAEGSNAKQGTATLAGGTVTVANTSVTANSRIFLTAQTTGAGPGALRVSARTPGTSFTITSSNGADTSVVAYEIFEPG